MQGPASSAPTPTALRSLVALLGWTVCSVCASACALDWSFSHDVGAAPDGSVRDAEGTPDDGTNGDGGSDTGSSSEAGAGDGAADAGSGCHANSECDAGSFCHYPDHHCGQGAGGICTPLPSGCLGGPYACTCTGGVDVTGTCGAESTGLDVSTLGCASPPPGSACGYVYCVTPCVQGTSSTGESTFSCQ